MGWIQTFTGLKVDPLNIRPEQIRIDDIAHALAMKCRYTGHCPQFYSVAQHSVLVAQHCKKSKLWALLHDAPEAYLFDAARPVKQGLREMIGEAFDKIERNVMLAVCQRFDLPFDEPKEVKAADTLLLTTEAKAFFGGSKSYQDWDHRPDRGFPIISPAVICCWTWKESEESFRGAFGELWGKHEVVTR